MALKSWLSIPVKSQFSLANLPFGVCKHHAHIAIAVAVGDWALDLKTFIGYTEKKNLPESIKAHEGVFYKETLNAFAALGRPFHCEVRRFLQDIFKEDTEYPKLLKDNVFLRDQVLIPRQQLEMLLPMEIGDYTDFYAGKNHAYNVGVMFRGPENALQPNYTHLPVGYHGRASSVVVSGTPIKRPWGQILENPTAEPKIPVLSPCKKLDFELELGAFLCKANKMGKPISIKDAEEYIFGYVLLNDWSARDIQAWEYVPLGPFTSKSFATTISPWVVLADAMEPFTDGGLKNDSQLLPYLVEKRKNNVLDIDLEVLLHDNDGNLTTLTRTNSKNLLFSFSQMLVHHTVTGCPMRVGDLLGSGTISGTEPGTQGSMLEQCSNGKTTVTLNGNSKRTFLENGDSVSIMGCAGKTDGGLVGFGECSGRIDAPTDM
ncbi:MAG: hypothetical protein MMC33_008918 [Icmadophila ericetorum]|nr:hypothetical protein [Icmadophila ericetorum]